MTRCAARFDQSIAGFALCSLLMLSSMAPLPAAAELAPDHRVFPAHSLRGELQLTSAADLRLNGQAARLAPGARIRGENNQLLMSGSLVGQSLVVHYTRERSSGLLMDVWVLRAVERSNRLWPTTEEQAQAWVFSPADQTWKRP